MLDTCSSVQEVLTAASTIRIDQNTTKLHYFIADRNCDCAIIEFLHGKMNIYNSNLPIRAISNSPYENSINDIMAGKTEWNHYEPYDKNAMERFLAVSERLGASTSNKHSIENAVEILDSAQREDTVYRLVYDIEQLEIYAFMNNSGVSIKIAFADFDFSKKMPSQASNLHLLQSEQVREQFVPYDTALNLQAVHSFFRDPILTSILAWNITDEMIHYLASYPDTFE